MGGCLVRNCKNRSKKGLRAFKVPSDLERRKLWLSLCKRTDCPDSAQVCEAHFDESQYELHRQDGWKKLKHNAIPTIFDPYARGLKMKKVPDSVRAYTKTELDGNEDRKSEDDCLSQKRCLICYEIVTDFFHTVSNEDDICSEFGRILLLILKPIEAKILSNYCCASCSENVVTCFTLLAELNLATLLTNRQTNETKYAVGGEICPVCGHSYQTHHDLVQHFSSHILNGDANRVTQAERVHAEKNNEQNPSDLVILSHPDDGVSLIKIEHSYNKDREWKSKECSRVCHVCGKFYKNRNNMTRHLKAHGPRHQPLKPVVGTMDRFDPDVLICNRCGRIFKQRYSLANHMVLRHGYDPDTFKLSDPDKTTLPCKWCDEIFQSTAKYLKHLTEAHELSSGLRCQCEVCAKWFKNKLSLRRHIKKAHMKYDTFACIVCFRRFKTEKTLNKHFFSQHFDKAIRAPEKIDNVHVIDPNSVVIREHCEGSLNIIDSINAAGSGSIVGNSDGTVVAESENHILEQSVGSVTDLGFRDLLSLSATSTGQFVRLDSL